MTERGARRTGRKRRGSSAQAREARRPSVCRAGPLPLLSSLADLVTWNSRHPKAKACLIETGGSRPRTPVTPGRLAENNESPACAGLSNSISVLTEALLDEQHLLVLRQRPQVVRDDLLELVGGGAYLGHRLELPVASVNGQLEPLDAIRVDVRRLEIGERGDEVVHQPA